MVELRGRSFAGLGLIASGSTLTSAQFLQPGRLAGIGVDAGHPILTQIGELWQLDATPHGAFASVEQRRPGLV